MLKTIRVKTPQALSTSCTVVSPDTFWTNHVYKRIADYTTTSWFILHSYQVFVYCKNQIIQSKFLGPEHFKLMRIYCTSFTCSFTVAPSTEILFTCAQPKHFKHSISKSSCCEQWIQIPFKTWTPCRPAVYIDYISS